MRRVNFRKLVLAVADIFIIVIGGILSNYLLSLFGVTALASRELLYAIVINLLVCILFMFVAGGYSRLWRYFNVKDYGICLGAMFGGFCVG